MSKLRILFAEDEAFGEAVQTFLEVNGFEVSWQGHRLDVLTLPEGNVQCVFENEPHRAAVAGPSQRSPFFCLIRSASRLIGTFGGELEEKLGKRGPIGRHSEWLVVR